MRPIDVSIMTCGPFGTTATGAVGCGAAGSSDVVCADVSGSLRESKRARPINAVAASAGKKTRDCDFMVNQRVNHLEAALPVARALASIARASASSAVAPVAEI